MRYKPKQRIELYAPHIIRIVNGIIFLSYLSVMIINTIHYYREDQFVMVLVWILLPIIFLVPYFILGEWYIRKYFAKEMILDRNRLKIIYIGRIVEIPFDSIKRIEIDENGIINYFTDLDFKYNLNFQRGQITSNVLDDEIVNVLEKGIK